MCRKQRHYDGTQDGEPTIKLWRHVDSGQFVASPDAAALDFKRYPHEEFL